MSWPHWANWLRLDRDAAAPEPAVWREAVAEDDPAWRLVQRALREMIGFGRGLFYDLPRGDAPRPRSDSRVFLDGSAAWCRYLDVRQRLDDGGITLVLSLRPLDDSEALLAVDWGNSHANAFLLVEPSDPSCDLAERSNESRQRLLAVARALDRDPDADPDHAWTRDTALGEAVRRLYGVWVAWPSPHATAEVVRTPLRLLAPRDTLAGRLHEALPRRYPQPEFDAALASLHERETELFGGPVTRARIPFLTRLGLPVLHDPHCADRALRQLVNTGRAWVAEPGPDPGLYRGPARPVPEGMSDAEFEQLVMY